MPVQIRKTTIIPHDGGAIVEMLIADELPDGPDPKFSILLRIKPDFPNQPSRTILTTLQLFALQAAQKQLTDVLGSLRKPIEKPTAADAAAGAALET